MNKPTNNRTRNNIAATKYTQHAQQHKVTVHEHRGPIPAPDILEGYERILPGSAERVIAMAEQQAQHRRDLERRQLEADIAHREHIVNMQRAEHKSIFQNNLIGQICGFMIAAACVAGAIYSALLLQNPILTAIFLGLPVIGMIKALRGNADTPHNNTNHNGINK